MADACVAAIDALGINTAQLPMPGERLLRVLLS
jgi:hypothetical protein